MKTSQIRVNNMGGKAVAALFRDNMFTSFLRVNIFWQIQSCISFDIFHGQPPHWIPKCKPIFPQISSHMFSQFLRLAPPDKTCRNGCIYRHFNMSMCQKNLVKNITFVLPQVLQRPKWSKWQSDATVIYDLVKKNLYSKQSTSNLFDRFPFM